MTQAITDKDFATETDEGLVLIDFWGNLVWPLSYASTHLRTII